MTVQEWWAAASIICEEEKKRMDEFDPEVSGPTDLLALIRRTLQRLEQIGLPRVQ